jgi:proteasome activator subunit 4
MPMKDLTKGHDDVKGNMFAKQWIASEVDRMEQEGATVEMNFDTRFSGKDEETILRSLTTGFAEFLELFLDRVFTLLEN